MKDETHFEVVESGRFFILLLGRALSVVWDRRLVISVVLKQTFQVCGLCSFVLSGPSPAPLSWGEVLLLATPSLTMNYKVRVIMAAPGLLHVDRNKAALLVFLPGTKFICIEERSRRLGNIAFFKAN